MVWIEGWFEVSNVVCEWVFVGRSVCYRGAEQGLLQACARSQGKSSVGLHKVQYTVQADSDLRSQTA